MSGAQMMMLASGGAPGSVNTSGAIGANAGGVLSLNPDGSSAMTGGGSTSTNWYNPTTSGIGTAHWVFATRTGGTGSTTISNSGSWIQLNATVSFSAGGGAGSSQGTFQFSTSASGTPNLGGYPFSVNNTL